MAKSLLDSINVIDTGRELKAGKNPLRSQWGLSTIQLDASLRMI